MVMVAAMVTGQPKSRSAPLAIAVGLQDRTDRGVGAGADLERAGAGGLKPLGAVALGQPKDADAGAEGTSPPVPRRDHRPANKWFGVDIKRK
jgi:hypothetical protein